MPITSEQAEQLGLRGHSQLSPFLEACCLRVSANVSYQHAAEDILALTGMMVSKSVQQRLVHRQEFVKPEAEATVTERACGWRQHSIANARGGTLYLERVQSCVLA